MLGVHRDPGACLGAAALLARGERVHPMAHVSVWGAPVPLITALNEIGETAQQGLHGHLEDYHALAGWLMLTLVILHVAGALKHQFVDREDELARMGFGRSRRPTGGRVTPVCDHD